MAEGMAAGLGSMVIFFWAILIVAGIMAIFIPFWVLRIRNEAIAANRSLARIAQLLAAQSPSAASDLQTADQPKFKLCPECGHQNAAAEKVCTSCRQRME